MKLLIVGYGRHGKDTVAELINLHTNMKFQSSSLAAAEHVIYPKMREDYKSVEECFEDRGNRREEWYNLISEYNREDSSRLAKEILQHYDIYVGMRSIFELECSRSLFDLIIWVDASERLPPESNASCTITKNCADVIIDNNGTLEDLDRKVRRLSRRVLTFRMVGEDVVNKYGVIMVDKNNS
jgi:hypothetical protein